MLGFRGLYPESLTNICQSSFCLWLLFVFPVWLFTIYCTQVFNLLKLLFLNGKKIHSVQPTVFITQTTIFYYNLFAILAKLFISIHSFLEHQFCSIGSRLFSCQYHHALIYGAPYFHFESEKYMLILFFSGSGLF